MALFPKLETAIDQGMILIAEAITLVRLANGVLRGLQPTVDQLPEMVRSARALIEAVHTEQVKSG